MTAPANAAIIAVAVLVLAIAYPYPASTPVEPRAPFKRARRSVSTALNAAPFGARACQFDMRMTGAFSAIMSLETP
jgi:hypothetical protein